MAKAKQSPKKEAQDKINLGAGKGKATQFKSGEQAQKAGAKGGKASGAARREKKLLRELAQMILDEEITDDSGRTMTRGEAALRVQARQAILNSDVKALAFLRDTAGQAPATQLDVSANLTSAQAGFSELLEQLNEAGD